MDGLAILVILESGDDFLAVGGQEEISTSAHTDSTEYSVVSCLTTDKTVHFSQHTDISLSFTHTLSLSHLSYGDHFRTSGD